MTKGCLRALESVRADDKEEEEKAEAGTGERWAAGEEVEEDGGEERSPSRRRPEKWGPEAASIT